MSFLSSLLTPIYTLFLASSLIISSLYASPPEKSTITDEQKKLLAKFYRAATGLQKPIQKKEKKSKEKKATKVSSENNTSEKALKLLSVIQAQDNAQEILAHKFDLEISKYKRTETVNNANYFLDHRNREDVDLKDQQDVFEKVLNFLENADTIKDTQGRTKLMLLANQKKLYDEDIKIAEALLAKGASPYLTDNKGLDALSISLLANNKEIISLLKPSIELSKLNPRAALLLDISEGKDVRERINVQAQGEKQLLFDAYRVANQNHNYAIVNFIYEQLGDLRTTLEKFLNAETTKQAYHFYPPFWAYNISQLRSYVLEKAKTLPILDLTKLTHNHGNVYTYKLGNETIRLYKKGIYDTSFSRILGRDHLEKIATELGYRDALRVPRKFISFGKDVPQEIIVTIRLPSSSGQSDEVYESIQKTPFGVYNTNSQDISFETPVELYAEYIEGSRVSPVEIKNNEKVTSIIAASCLSDIGGGNLIRRANDGLLYCIDTEGPKNFLPKLNRGEQLSIAETKELSFDRRLETISFKLSPQDFNIPQ